MDENAKALNCKYSFPDLKSQGEFTQCIHNATLATSKRVSSVSCETCPNFKHRYVQYPIEVTKITNKELDYRVNMQLVMIKPCAKEHQGKTYMGLLLGELPWQISTGHNSETGELVNSVIINPAIYVPELNKIIFGAESWWRRINSPEDYKDITQRDIDNTWYMQMLTYFSK